MTDGIQTDKTVSGAPAEGYAFDSARYAWFVVLVICGLNVGSYIDRQVINLMVQEIRRDFKVTDVQISLLQGLAFATFYSVAAVPMGWLADRWLRRWIIIIGVAFWSAATIGCMLAKDYPSLFVARMLVGLGEACLIPAGYSLLSDYFPRAKVSGAISSVTGASFLGSGVALSFGGFVLARLPSSGHIDLPFVGDIHAWQLAFGAAAVPSLVMIAAMWFVKEPPRRGVSRDGGGGGASFAQMAGFIRREAGLWLPLVVGMVLLNTYQFGLSTWAVTFFLRTYGWSVERIGLLYGAYFVVIGSIASLAGGLLCDRLVARGRRDANLIIPLACAIVALPLTLVFALCGDATLSAVLLGGLTFVGVIPFGPAISAIPLLAPNTMRAQLIALYILIMTLAGSTAGPWLIATATEALFKDPMAIRYSIALVGGIVLSLSILCLAFGVHNIRRLGLGQGFQPAGTSG